MEFQQVSRRLAGLAAKRSSVVLGLWGEPGIGKTHRALALLGGAPCQSLTVHATQTPESFIGKIQRPKKISVWLQRSLERAHRGEARDVAALVQTLAALLTANAPMILHVEDLHEATAERLEFWTQLAPMVSRTRGVGLIVTSRANPPDGFEAVRLSPLSRQASDALLEAEVSATLPGEALSWLFERVAGNPLYTLEFFRFLARQGFVWNDGHRWRWRAPEREVMPITVEGLIERMLREATGAPALEDAIRAKAVLGLGANDDVWAKVAELTPENLSESKRELERQGILVRGEFAHPLYREVIAHSLTPECRQTFARRALQALEADPQRAASFIEDAQLEPAQALAWLERAVGAATEAGNEVQSSRFKAKAVAYANGEVRARLALEAARGLRRADIPEALRLAELAEAGSSDDFKTIELLADLLASQGRLEDADCVLQRLPEQERSGPSWWLRRMKVRAAAQDHTAVIELWREHPEVGELHDPEIAYAVAFALTMRGVNQEAHAIASKTLKQPGLAPEDRSRLIGVLASLRYSANDPSGAERFEDQALEAARQANRPDMIAVYLHNRALSRGDQGRRDEQIADLKEAINLHAEIGNGVQVIRAQVSLTDALLDLAQYEQAEELLLECRDVLKRSRLADDFLIECEYRLSQLYRDWGMIHGGILAIKHAHAALEMAKRAASPTKIGWSLCYVAIAEAKFGDASQSKQFASEAIRLSSELQFMGVIGMARLAQALALEALGERERARNELRELEMNLIEQGLTEPAQEVGLELDRLLGDAVSGASRLAWFELSGLKNMANVTRRYFPGLTERQAQTSDSTTRADGIRLEVLGPMQLRQDGVITPLRGGKRKELLALLLEARIRGRTEVSSLDLCDALYPDGPEDVALDALKATIFKIRSSLGTSLIATTPNGYGLGAVATDAEDFLQTGDAGLWRGPYLEDAALEGRDENVREALYHALETNARAHLETIPHEAERLGRILMLAEPYDARALEITCRALLTDQNHKGLSRFYSEAWARMLEVGETLPERWEDFLEAQIV